MRCTSKIWFQSQKEKQPGGVGVFNSVHAIGVAAVVNIYTVQYSGGAGYTGLHWYSVGVLGNGHSCYRVAAKIFEMVLSRTFFYLIVKMS